MGLCDHRRFSFDVGMLNGQMLFWTYIYWNNISKNLKEYILCQESD